MSPFYLSSVIFGRLFRLFRFILLKGSALSCLFLLDVCCVDSPNEICRLFGFSLRLYCLCSVYMLRITQLHIFLKFCFFRLLNLFVLLTCFSLSSPTQLGVRGVLQRNFVLPFLDIWGGLRAEGLFIVFWLLVSVFFCCVVFLFGACSRKKTWGGFLFEGGLYAAFGLATFCASSVRYIFCY